MRAETSAKSPTCMPEAVAARRVWQTGAWKSSSGSRLPASGTLLQSLPAKLLFYCYESAANFVHYSTEICHQQRFLRIDHHIRTDARSRTRKPHGLAPTP